MKSDALWIDGMFDVAGLLAHPMNPRTHPPEQIEPCILAGSRVGDIVLDPFMGSGTVAQVAQALGRKWLGCELNPDYAKMIERRTAEQGLALA